MKVIITGASGMVGRGVLYECLEDERITKILLINRTNLEMQHEKLEQVELKDFTEAASIKSYFSRVDACFFCMGVSSIGMSEKEFHGLTYLPVKIFSDLLYEANKQSIFIYVSGQGTDSSEKGSIMWARVKGKTENEVLNKGFKDAYAFRPGAIIPEKGIKSRTNWYQYIYVIMTPFFPLLKKMKSITTTTKLGKAMINLMFEPSELKHLENSDINQITINN